ncbi:hypothetical protein RM555_12305 [Micromonospora sp. DSM 115977]|uniref:DUF7768 domain-containing protein n=1 Tax=Micromonospora reichwaldensis TaxID=3075516 RepID=A0ABU2WV13_9ACTN|nr:hypothetical protein [Micromonospora sp. DSM 115977]MDT0529770.1 hypothetical protein [Micromonospora sp. DSM 115977]
MDITERILAVYTAHSKLTFYCRDVISEFVLRNNAVPLNPFRVFDYFLGDRVDRDLVRRGNNNLVAITDETWVFGDIANGVYAEIELAHKLGKPVRYFSISTRVAEIKEIQPGEVRFEDEVLAETGMPVSQLSAVLTRTSGGRSSGAVAV